MIESVEQLKGILDYVGRHVSSPATAYLIGGGALMMHGLKDTTKDIDLATDPQATNYIISGLREADNSWTCHIGDNQYLFLKIFLNSQDITVELFANDEYKLLEGKAAIISKHDNLTVEVPCIRELFVLKDRQLKALLKEGKKRHKEEDD